MEVNVEKLNKEVQKLYVAEDLAHESSVCEVCKHRSTLRVMEAERKLINTAKSMFKKEG